MLQLNWLWLVVHSWAPVCVCMCTYRTGLQRYKARSTKANLQHVWILPWWTPPGWDRKTGAAPYQILTACQELMCCTMLCLHFTHFQCCFQLNWMQSKLFRTSLSRLEHVSTSALLYHCVCMRLLTENVHLHHASWFQSFSVLQRMNYGSFLACSSSHRAQTSLADGHVLNCVCSIVLTVDCGFSFCLFSFHSLCFPLFPHLFLLLFLCTVPVSGWRFPSSGTQLPAAHQWSPSAGAGARVGEEPLRNRECARLCFPLSHFTA